MNKGVRSYAATSATALVRPELVEIKNTIKNLKKEAEMRLTLDVEAQQSFDFLSDQVHGLRKAFSTLSDVLIEEVDLIRSEANDRNEELEQRIEAMSKAHRTMKTELTLQRSEAQTARAAATTKSAAVEERLELMQEDMTVLAQEVAKGNSAHHLLQLEVVQLRAQLEEEARERRAQADAYAQKLSELTERFDAHAHDARTSMQALDTDLSTIQVQTEQQLASQLNAIEANKGKLLQCGQAVEKLWSANKVQQQRLESVSSSGSLHNQQLQERLETVNKQHIRWRTTLEETVKAVAADVQLLQTHGRAMETAIGSNKVETRRLVSEHESEMQRQCDTLGRAIHALAETLNLSSPLVGMGSTHYSPE